MGIFAVPTVHCVIGLGVGVVSVSCGALSRRKVRALIRMP